MKTKTKRSAKKTVTVKKQTPKKSEWIKKVSASGKTYYTKAKQGDKKSQPAPPVKLKKRGDDHFSDLCEMYRIKKAALEKLEDEVDGIYSEMRKYLTPRK